MRRPTSIDSLKARIIKASVEEGDCVVWGGRLRPDGYARTKWNGSYYYVHRLVWELYRGPIPEGLQVDHLCRNRGCFNLNHLELVTPAENARRGVSHNARKTHCPHGHEYAGDNLIRVRRFDPKRGHLESERQCRACRLETRRRMRVRAKEREAS